MFCLTLVTRMPTLARTPAIYPRISRTAIQIVVPTLAKMVPVICVAERTRTDRTPSVGEGTAIAL